MTEVGLAELKVAEDTTSSYFSHRDNATVVDSNPADGTVIAEEINQPISKQRWWKWNRKSKEHKDEEKKYIVPFLSLFRYATNSEKVKIIAGCVSAILHGAILPMFDILFGKMIDAFGPENNIDGLRSRISELTMIILLLGVGSFITSYLQVHLLMTTAQSQGRRMRMLYLRSLMAQDMEWYDQTNPAELTARVSGDVGKVEDGMGDRVATFFQYSAMGITGLLIGLGYGWKLTLVVLTSFPLLIASGAILGQLQAKYSSKGQLSYSKAGAVAEEALSLMRVVVAFGGEEREKERFDIRLKEAFAAGISQANASGIGLGVSMGVLNLVFALAFWYGNKLVESGEMSAGSIVTVFFSVIFGGMSLGQIAPSLTAFSIAQGAAYFLFEMIEREPIIDSLSLQGEVPPNVEGTLTFDHVNFTYKSRKEGLILKDMCFQLKSGETLALVGPSGCGKSTIIQLLERFYDPIDGAVKLDDQDIRHLSLPWLRSQISLVSQMPSLFAMTIGENIALGARLVPNKDYNPNLPETRENRRYVRESIGQEAIMDAARMANVHNFIMELPQGYDTMVGERGGLLSGGQKQRIAIARALVKNPRILLLDEATSALDSQSEAIVGQALEKAAKGRTTVVIAHRLSTIRNADCIAVVEQGSIVEIGSHEELMALEDGRYRRAVLSQKINDKEEKKNIEFVNEVENPLVIGEKPCLTGGQSGKDILLHPDVENREERESAKRRVKRALKSARDYIWTPGISSRAFGLVRKDALWILLGFLGAIMAGAVWPVFAVVMTKVINVILLHDKDAVNTWIYVFIGLAAVVFLGNYTKEMGLGLAGHRLTYILRKQCFTTMIHQPMSWFDDTQHSVGILSARLSNDAAQVKALTGDTLGGLIQQLSTIGIGLVIALIASWKVTLVLLPFIPAIGIGAAFQMRQMSGFAVGGNQAIAEAGKVASEVVANVRSVTACNAAYEFLDSYEDKINATIRPGIRKAIISSLILALTEFMQFAIWALAFDYGVKLVIRGEVDFENLLLAISSLVFGVLMAGQVSAMTPDMAKARVAAKCVFELIDMVPNPDVRDHMGMIPSSLMGDLAFKSIYFEYPARAEVPVLKGLTVSIDHGCTLALVGESGCGKSTIIGLLERFYDEGGGQALLDGRPLKDYNLAWLRDQMSLVSQEPDLFNTTVRANILYGVPSTQLCVITEEMVQNAAKLANAHEFIMKLPHGYDAEVGHRGGYLSGGQRQRIALARALIRQPKILLLDEATSALDSESERVVQQALDKAKEGRTVITIAHRLVTIQDADRIAVVHRGIIAEQGTHNQLLNLGGLYADMVYAQNRR